MTGGRAAGSADRTARQRASRLLGVPGVLWLATLAFPAIASAHQLNARFESPLPLVVYLVGAAAAVGMSFVIVLARDVRVLPETTSASAKPSASATASRASGAASATTVPLAVRYGLRSLGLIAWAWIVVQGLIVGGSSDADVGSLFLWVYGWVGMALVSALVGPAWSWLDPFTALYDLGAWCLARVGLRGWVAMEYPVALGRWPAVAGYAVFVWLELVLTGGGGGSRLAGAMVLYTVVTLFAMAAFGRDGWRSRGETFSVWFGVLGRLAPYEPVGPPEGGRVRRRPFLAGSLGTWDREALVLIALAVAGVLYDGLSQTALFVGWFGLPPLGEATILLLAWLGLLVAISLLVARLVGLGPLAGGLLPIAVGYIAAHYLTFLLIDGQRILIALSDPFQQGWDLLGTAFYVPGAFFAAGLMWAVQLGAVVGGHVIGALTGHDLAVRGEARARRLDRASAGRSVRLRQVPLALLMVGLTVTTLWSLGQKVVQPAGSPAAAGALAGPPGPRIGAREEAKPG